MTREEAREILQEQIDKYGKVASARGIEALEFAIKALAEKALDEYVYKDKTLREWIKAIEQTQWIPCSERLPEIMDGTNGECSDDVLICVADDENITISTGFYGYYPRSTSLQGWWSMWADGCHQLDSKYKVVAWMPLPKPLPYKAEEV